MTDSLTYESLQRRVSTQVLRYAFSRGYGGPLVVLWLLGAGLLLTVWEAPLYAGAWTAASGVFAALTARDYFRNESLRLQLHRATMEARYPVAHLTDEGHRLALQKGTQIFVEVLGKLQEIKHARGLDDDLVQTVTDMDRLLALQFESARQCEEMGRVLRLIQSRAQPGPMASVARPAGLEEAAALRQQNIETIEHEATEAETLVEVIGQRLETVMLQVFQMEKRTIDVVTAAEARQGTAEAIERLQNSVDARRAAATQLMEFLSPGSPASAG